MNENLTIRRHSSDDMAGLGEFRDVPEPVAVVLRDDGSVDVYGYVAVLDQRDSLPRAPIRIASTPAPARRPCWPAIHAVDNFNQCWCGGTPVPSSHLSGGN